MIKTATPIEIANCFTQIFKDSEPSDITISFSDFAYKCEEENINQEEISNVAYMCERVDEWTGNC